MESVDRVKYLIDSSKTSFVTQEKVITADLQLWMSNYSVTGSLLQATMNFSGNLFHQDNPDPCLILDNIDTPPTTTGQYCKTWLCQLYLSFIAFRQVCRDRNANTTKLRNKPIYFRTWESSCKLVDRKHKFIRLSPSN